MQRWLIALLTVCAPLFAQDDEDAAFSVSGQVVTTAGRPCEGAHVQLWDALASDRPLARAAVDKEGKFELTVTLSAIARREHPFGPVRIEASKVGRARVGGRIAPGTSKLRIVLPKPAVWTGVLRDPDGVALPGAPIRAEQGELRFATTTDENGAYAFTDMGDGQMDLGLEKAKKPLTWISLYAEGHAAKRFAAAAGEAVDTKLEPMPVRQGRVLDAETKQPLAGVRVIALRVSSPVETVTDAEGKFALEVDGRYGEVAMQLPGYAIARRSLNVGDFSARDHGLRRAVPVGGTVVDEEGRAIPFADVKLDVGFGPPVPTRCDEDGRFRFEFGVDPFGCVTALRRGYLPAQATVDANWRADRVRVEVARGREVTGAVTTADGGVLGAELVFRRRVPPGIWADVARAYTNEKGAYRARAIPPGATHVFARSAAGRSELVEIDDRVDLSLADRLSLSGRVIDDEGQPLAGVRVHSADFPDSATETDAEGRFRIANVPIGRWGLLVDTPKGYVRPILTPIAGEPELVVVDRIRGSLQLKVRCPARRSGFSECVLRSGEMRRRVWLPDGAQELTFGALGPGQYVLEMDASGYIPYERKIEITAAGPNESVIELERAGTLIFTATPGARLVVQTLSGQPSPVVSRRLEKARVVIGGFGPGRYRLIARAPDEIIVIREITVGPKDAPREVDLVGGAASTLDVVVKGADGSPVEGASIELVTEGGFTFRTSKRTDSEGQVTISRLILGPLQVVARLGDDRADKGIRIEAGAQQSITIEFR